MRSHVRMVKSANRTGDYAVSLNLADETQWCPVMECQEDECVCPLPVTGAAGISGSTDCSDYCSVQMPLSEFAGQDLSSARFMGSELSCSNFKKAKLHAANFSNSDLCQTNLSYADLRDANFTGADLSFADLRYSDLRGAKLEGVRFKNVEIKGAKFDRQTQLPISKDEAEGLGMIYCF